MSLKGWELVSRGLGVISRREGNTLKQEQKYRARGCVLGTTNSTVLMLCKVQKLSWRSKDNFF